ncbi:hypothetical protein K0038_01259 [Pseudomonas syringae]|nr:hypothetical protein [Pseudomonas syringae]
MALLERRHGLLNQLVSHDQLDFPFLHRLDRAILPDKWLAAIQWAELAVAEYLPRALIVSADSPCTRREYSALDLVHMTRRNKESELVHAP